MATPRKDVSRYSKGYFMLFEAALKGIVRIEYKTETEARRERDKLYAYRTALLSHPEISPDLALAAPALEFRREGTTLVISSSHDRSQRYDRPTATGTNTTIS